MHFPLLSLKPGEVHAIIGESGSGKTLTLSAVMGLLPPGLKAEGRLTYEGQDLIIANKDFFLSLRGKQIGMVFQEPMTALNPQMTCGKQVLECLPSGFKKKDARIEVEKVLSEVGLSDVKRFYESYPHQISGGQRQRIMIAMAVINQPALILADEPTTALDSITENEIMELLCRKAAENNAALILVTHNLSLVTRYCSSMSLLRKGELLQQGSVRECFSHPHPYLNALIEAMPSGRAGGYTEKEAVFEVSDLSFNYPNSKTGLQPVTLKLNRGEVLCVVGLSGSGKTTLAKLLTGLLKTKSGEVSYEGRSIIDKRPTGVQMVFQDPYSSLNVFHKNLDIVMEPMRVAGLSRQEAANKAAELMQRTGLAETVYNKTPAALSGGQRQRLCIARALAGNPDILILDEAVAALDPLVQKQILDLLETLRRQTGIIYLFITHNMAVAKSLGNKFLLLENGEGVFYGSLEEAEKVKSSNRLLQALVNA